MKLEKIAQIQLQDKMRRLKFEQFSNILLGNPRRAKKYHQEFAKIAVKNFDLAKTLSPPIKGSFSIFSKQGFNALKYIFFDFFAKDSAEEKQLKKLWHEFNYKRDINL